MRGSPLRRCALAALALLAVAGPARHAAADETQRRPYQVRDDDAARIDALEFRRHAERGEWRSAILRLQDLLDLPAARSVVMRVEGARPVRYESASEFALRLFESLPPEGRAMWEELERRPGEELLQRGLRLRRDEDLAAAARRFPARDIRRRAHDALAQLATGRGDFDRAGRELTRLLAVTEPGERPGVLARLVFARAQQGDAERTQHAAHLCAPHRDAVVPGPAGPVKLGDFAQSMVRLATSAAARPGGARQFGGDRHGSGVSEPPPLPESFGWSAPTRFLRGDEAEDQRRYDDPTFRPVRPAVSQGLVLANDGLSLTATELASGRPVWRLQTPLREAEWRDHQNAFHTVSVSEGVAYAALATRADSPEIERRFYGRLILYSRPHRALHAVDARSGELLWSHESSRIAGRADAAEIERESVASPPLVVGDDVIVATSAFNLRYDVRLVCFDRHTGATRWRTSVAQGQQEMNLFGNPVKELLTSPLAELDGVIYFATGLGVAAAVDRVTGGVAWISEYDQTEIPQTYQWFETRDRAVTWRTSPVAATPGAIVMAPTDGTQIFALRPDSGARLWQAEQRPSAGTWYRWFLGVLDGRAYVLGSKLQCLDLDSGRAVWTDAEAGRLGEPRERAGEALGAGLLTPTAVHVPTAAGLLELDPRTGAFRAARKLPEPDGQQGKSRPWGDLVAGDGALLVASERTIDCYYRFEDLRDRLRARIEAAPDDASLRLEAGEVFRAAGRLDDAVACLEHGLSTADRAPPRTRERIDAAIRRSLHEALIARSRTRHAVGDSDGAYADLDRAVAVARDHGDAVRALFALAEAAGSGPKSAVGDAALRRIVAEFADVATTLPAGRVDAGPAAAFELAERSARAGDVRTAVDRWFDLLDRWPEGNLGSSSVTVAVRARLEALAREGSPDVARRIEQRARAGFDAARGRGDLDAVVRVARSTPSPAVAAEAAAFAGSRLLDAGRARDAAAMLEGLDAHDPEPEVRYRALWTLAAAYRAMEEAPRERSALRRIADGAGPVLLDDGRNAAEAARAELAAERFRETPAALADPRPPLALQWETIGTDDPALQLLSVQGTRPRGLEGRLLFVQDQSLSLVDGARGDAAWRVSVSTEIRSVFGARSSVIVVGDDAQFRSRMTRIEAFRVSDGSRAWVRRVPGRYVASAASLGIVYVVRQDAGDSGERRAFLSAFSAESGEPAAPDRPLGPSVVASVTTAGDAVVLYEQMQVAQLPRRRAVTFDGSTLAPRGSIEIEGWTSTYSFSPPGTNLVVTNAGNDTVVAIDTATGAAAWTPWKIGQGVVKSVLPVSGGIVVADDGDRIRRLDAATGREIWSVPLGGEASLGWSGEASDGDLVVATLLDTSGDESATAVGLDAATGRERWRTRLPLEGSVRRVLPSPEILAGVVAYELNEKPADEFRSKVVLLDRTTGAVAAQVAHPVIGKSLQRAFFDGRFVILWAPPRADVAVYGPGAENR